MDIPGDFQFADNDKVHAFATERAVLLFGEDWKDREDLTFSHPYAGYITVAENKKSGWILAVLERKAPFTPTYTVSCLSNGELEDPAPNLAARYQFYSNGNPDFLAHYAAGKDINPPDGSPAEIGYKEGSGRIDGCWYVNGETRCLEQVPQEEVAERVEAAKLGTLANLCGRSQEIIALKPSISPIPHSAG